MPLTLAQLRTTLTRDQALQTMIDELDSLGFQSTSWQTGSVQRTILTAIAEIWSRLTLTVDTVSRIWFLDDASDATLTTLADSHYDNQRVTSLPTQGTVRLTDDGGVGPVVIAVGQLVAVESETGNSLTYRNITGGTLALSSFLDLTFEAETAGQQGNVGNGSITTLTAPIAGVSVNNPGPGGGVTWRTRDGIDEETDATLRSRCRTKWATLSIAAPPEAYENFAITADTDVTRATVDDANPRGPGTVDVHIARATGIATGPDTPFDPLPATPTDAQTVRAFIEARRPVTADVRVFPADPVNLNLIATVHVTASLHDGAGGLKEQEIEQAATDYINSLDIGGEVLTPGPPPQGFVIFSELIGAVTAVAGVRRVSFVSPAADVPIGVNQVAVAQSITFTYVDVD